jgi:serine/threonine protein kinase
MGCSGSKECVPFLYWEGFSIRNQSRKPQRSSKNYNENEIDLSNFSSPQNILGIGGFGMVRLLTKLSGSDKNQSYALKSLSKFAILQRSSGINAAFSELKALALLVDAVFVCSLHYAFQDEKFLYMVIDLASGGDLRLALKISLNHRFDEVRARFYIAQVILAIDCCHGSSILHRGAIWDIIIFSLFDGLP